MRRIRNIALWFASLVLAVSLFSLFWGPAAFVFIFRVTMIFALPVACLYLPFVIALPDAENGRIGVILVSGVLFGPVALALWNFILGLRGHPIWHEHDVGPGFAGFLLFALIVGSMTTTFYVIALKLVHRRRA